MSKFGKSRNAQTPVLDVPAVIVENTLANLEQDAPLESGPLNEGRVDVDPAEVIVMVDPVIEVPVVEDKPKTKAFGVKKHIAEIFTPLAKVTEITKCGKSEAKITFDVAGKKMTAYIRSSRGGFILQLPFSKAERQFGEFIDDTMFFSHETSKQRVYRFATPAMLMEIAENAYERSLTK